MVFSQYAKHLMSREVILLSSLNLRVHLKARKWTVHLNVNCFYNNIRCIDNIQSVVQKYVNEKSSSSLTFILVTSFERKIFIWERGREMSMLYFLFRTDITVTQFRCLNCEYFKFCSLISSFSQLYHHWRLLMTDTQKTVKKICSKIKYLKIVLCLPPVSAV